MAKALGAIFAKQLRTGMGKAESHTQMVKAVRAAARRLQLQEDDRREIQLRITGKRSMSDMDLADLGKLLDHLNRDWKGPSGHRAHVGKIRALWWTLYWLGIVDSPKPEAIDVFVRRQTGISALRFVDSQAAHRIIEGLKAWAAREGGVRWPQPGTGRDPLIAERVAVADAIWMRLRDANAVSLAGLSAYVSTALKISPDPSRWVRAEWDAAIKLLGKRLRREQGRTVE